MAQQQYASDGQTDAEFYERMIASSKYQIQKWKHRRSKLLKDVPMQQKKVTKWTSSRQEVERMLAAESAKETNLVCQLSALKVALETVRESKKEIESNLYATNQHLAELRGVLRRDRDSADEYKTKITELSTNLRVWQKALAAEQCCQNTYNYTSSSSSGDCEHSCKYDVEQDEGTGLHSVSA